MQCSLHWAQGACTAPGHKGPPLCPGSIQRHPNATSCLLLRQIHSPCENSGKPMPKPPSSMPLFQSSLAGKPSGGGEKVGKCQVGEKASRICHGKSRANCSTHSLHGLSSTARVCTGQHLREKNKNSQSPVRVQPAGRHLVDQEDPPAVSMPKSCSAHSGLPCLGTATSPGQLWHAAADITMTAALGWFVNSCIEPDLLYS